MTSTQTIMSSPTTSRTPASEPISVQKQDMENGNLNQMKIMCPLNFKKNKISFIRVVIDLFVRIEQL